MAKTLYPDAPRVGVGAVVVHDHKVLLVLRNKRPAKGQWAIPGGSLELGETLQQGAEREVLEETGLRVKAGAVVFTCDSIHRDPLGNIMFHYVIVDVEATPIDPNQPLTPGDDVKDARWFSIDEVAHLDIPMVEATRFLMQKYAVSP